MVTARPAQPAGAAASSRSRGIALVTVAVIALTGLQLLRQPGTRSWQSIWAEDGAVYGREAFALPVWRTLFRGYGGYVQVVPRLLASPIRLIGVSGAAALFAVSASLVTALLAVFVFRCTAGWIDDVWLRLVVAAMTAVAPIASVETTANLANLGWPLLIACAWACVSRRTQTLDTVLRTVVVVATALSTTLAALLVPGALAIAIRRRQRRDWIVFVAFSLALALQLALDRSAEPAPRYGVTSTVGDLFEVFGVRVLGGAVIGERWLQDAWKAWHYGIVAIAVAVFVGIAVACRRAHRDRWILAAAGLLTAVVVFAVPVWIRGSAPMRLHAAGLRIEGSRYLVVPIALLVSAAAVLVDGAGRTWLRRLVVLHAVVLIAAGFQMSNIRSAARPWNEEVQRARVECRTQAADKVVRLAVSPAGLVMPVRCSRLQ